MKKSTLITLLINIYESLDYCNCFSAKRNLEFIINKLLRERVENDD